MKVGANVTLAQFVSILEEMTKISGYEYCAGLAKHILKVANVPVRNVSTFESILCLDFSGNVIYSDKRLYTKYRTKLVFIQYEINMPFSEILYGNKGYIESA